MAPAPELGQVMTAPLRGAGVEDAAAAAEQGEAASTVGAGSESSSEIVLLEAPPGLDCEERQTGGGSPCPA